MKSRIVNVSEFVSGNIFGKRLTNRDKQSIITKAKAKKQNPKSAK